jgi:RNA polymerase-binding transcription factor
MTDAQKMRFKAMLAAKRQELVREIHSQTAELAIDEGEHDPVDRVQSMTRRDQAANMLRRLSRTLSDVDGALRGMSEGSYGVCVECEEPIGRKRLETIPWASHCIGCQELVELRESLHAGHPGSTLHERREAA